MIVSRPLQVPEIGRSPPSHQLASGAKNAQLFYQAGTIYRAAGENGRSDEYLRMATELNPQPARRRSAR